MVSICPSAARSRATFAVAFWSTQPGSTRPLSLTPSGESHGRRSRPPSFAGASILPSPGPHRFAGLSTPSRHPAGSASISPLILRLRRFGPDVEWISEVDYAVDPARGEAFYAAIRAYWPALRDGALQPGYAGVRPKISGP